MMSNIQYMLLSLIPVSEESGEILGQVRYCN